MTVKAADYPISLPHNSGDVEEIQFLDENDGPIDLTGYAASAQIRLYGAQPGSAVIDLPSVGGDLEGIWISDAANGTIQRRVDQSTRAAAYAAHSAGQSPGADLTFEWDLRMTPPGAQPEVWLKGDYVIAAGVTV